MDTEAIYKNIRTIYQTISGKQDVDVSVTYRGTSHGITQPWYARVGDRECNNETHDGALYKLFNILKTELTSKTKSVEIEVIRLRQALNALGD